jgi:hypothetical protein
MYLKSTAMYLKSTLYVYKRHDYPMKSDVTNMQYYKHIPAKLRRFNIPVIIYFNLSMMLEYIIT